MRGLSTSYEGRVVLDHLDLEVHPGELVALLGRNGSGKSTLVRALAGLHPAPGVGRLSTGTVAVAFQEPRLLPWMRVWRNVALPLEGSRAPSPGHRARATAVAVLEEVGLGEHVDAWPLTLSGGEAQRVSLARALVGEPEVLLLDEPFSALDALTRMSLHQLLRRLRAARTLSILLVTHDVDEAIALAGRVVVLAGGRIASDRPVPALGDGQHGGSARLALRHELLADLGVPSEGPAGTTPQPG